MADNQAAQGTLAAPQGVAALVHAPTRNGSPSPGYPQNTGTAAYDPNYKKKTHLAKPAVFNGREFKGWWRTVVLYIIGNDQDFQTDRDKILFALSFMTEGQAEKWSQNYVDWVINENNEDFGTWAYFRREVAKSFENKNLRSEAQNKLDNLFQGRWTAEEFFQQFELLRREAGFTEKEHHTYLIALIEKHMDGALIDQMYTTIPLPTDYEVWRERITAFDSMKRRRAAIKTSSTPWRSSAPAASASRPAATSPQAARPAATSAPTPYQGGGGRLYGGMGQPMDLDAAKRKGLCFTCGQHGHISRFCPNKARPAQVRQQEQVASFDVRNLDHDGMKRLVTEWQSARDAKIKAEQDRQETDKMLSDF